MIATSSASRPHRAAVRRPPRPPRPVCTAPNAPKRTFASERFIARPMSIVSSVPEAPTSAPATIRTLLWSTKPAADAASPVNAFRSEITTGMSAPPIGRTKSTPKASAATISAHEQPLAPRPRRRSRSPSTTAPPSRRAVDDLLAGVDDRPPADELLELRERDEAAGERDAADQRRERDRDGLGVDAARRAERGRGTPRARSAPPRRRRRR